MIRYVFNGVIYWTVIVCVVWLISPLEKPFFKPLNDRGSRPDLKMSAPPNGIDLQNEFGRESPSTPFRTMRLTPEPSPVLITNPLPELNP
jgi:hypothetical protein